MTIFDLLFIVVFLTTVILLAAVFFSALRGRRPRAVAILRGLGIFLGIYFGIVIIVSLISPRRVLNVGDNQCWDDWCIAVADVRQQPVNAAVSYVVTFRLSSRARRRAQRERGVNVYILDERGRRYEPAVDPAAVPFDVLLQPQEVINTTRVFEVPSDAHDLLLGVSHGGVFPGCCIIGGAESPFHKGTVVRLK